MRATNLAGRDLTLPMVTGFLRSHLHSLYIPYFLKWMNRISGL